MRAKIIFGLLISFFAGIGAMAFVRGSIPGVGGAVPSDAGTEGGASTDAGADAGDAGGPPPDPGMLGRPLRVAGLGWELIAPGLVANMGVNPGKGSEYAAAHLPITLKGVATMDSLESSLARGGRDPEGADIAIMPLPLFVSAYERLRALEPAIFFVVGWSRGREALITTGEALPVFPATGDVPMIAAGGDLAVFLGLFSLDVAGVDPLRVHLMSQKTPKSEEIPTAVIDRVLTDEAIDKARRKIVLTTADATRLIPLVAVAQRSMIEQNPDVLALWARLWLDGQAMLRADVTAAARQMAGNQGAPEPISLVTRIGQIQPVSLTENAELAGLAGRSELTLETLFQRTWRIWRSSGSLATPPPSMAPVSTEVVSRLVRSADASMTLPVPQVDTPQPAPAPTTTVTPVVQAPAGAPPPPAPSVLLLHHEADGPSGAADLLESIGFLAGVFDRSPIRVTASKGATAKVIADASARYGLRPGRLVAGFAPLGAKDVGVIEVLPLE